MRRFITISEVSKILGLINSSSKKPSNHIIRYWEKEFKQIRPKMINNRRYFTEDQIEVIKLIKYLLKDKGLSIKGVKKILNQNANKLDDYSKVSLKTDYYKNSIKKKTKKILDKIQKLKKDGKKNSY